MKLHDLILLRDRLQESIDTRAVLKEIALVEESFRLVQQNVKDDEYVFRIQQVLDSIDDVKKSLALPVQQVDNVVHMLNADINDATAKFRDPDYKQQLVYRNPQRIREARVLNLPDGVDSYVKQSIDMYINWQYPALEIGCRDGEWTQYLVGCDPLYITDQHQEFLSSTLSKHTPEYQRRLRPYLIVDHDLSTLPLNQFGFVFSWNYFNYLTLDQARTYLSQIFTLLRPGGTVMFSYNNADMPGPAGYADSYYMSWMPKSLLVPMCKDLGYTVTSSTDFAPVSWIELRKPGELKLIKAHQVLGEIKFVHP